MSDRKLAFGKNNYTLMIIGMFTLALGFIIMTMDKEQYGFGFLGLTLGPIIVVIGFIIEIFAVLIKPKK
jgi:uncharacterized membrane protein HdeD (DUF308 family)